jgi:hypothetical protein
MQRLAEPIVDKAAGNPPPAWPIPTGPDML